MPKKTNLMPSIEGALRESEVQKGIDEMNQGSWGTVEKSVRKK